MYSTPLIPSNYCVVNSNTSHKIQFYSNLREKRTNFSHYKVVGRGLLNKEMAAFCDINLGNVQTYEGERRVLMSLLTVDL